MIEIGVGVHLAPHEIRALLAILDAACRVATPDARAADVIRRLRKTDERLTQATGNRQHGVTDGDESTHYSAYDLVDTAEAAAILGITPGGVRYLADAGRIPAHRAGGRRIYPAAAIVARAERQAERRTARR